MTRPASWILCLCLLALPLGYAVLTGGADDPDAFAVTVFDLGLAGLAGSLLLFRAAPASRPERLINAAAILFLVYVAFQLVPLPIPLLRILSPMRAEVAEALSPFTGPVRYAPLSVAPPTTWLQLARITAYAITFFVSRQLVRRSPFGPWTAALPIVLVGAAEAAWALATSGGAMQLLSGSYPNRNHFAGLLEMTLPFALMYGVSVLYRSGRRGVLAMTDVANAAVPFSLTVLMLVALLFSSSKSGVIASLFSLFFVTALALGRGLSRGRRWTFLALLTLLFLVAFVFLTPSELVQRFGSVASDQPTEGRVPVWRDTLRLIAAYPLFGCGLGAFFPAFLRYQIAGVGWAWTNAHNDYLQLFSELGFVGFLAPATLMTVVFGRAVSAASEPEARETRFIGLACAGSLTAILIHSVTDFNTYVTANGLVLAWVAGVAATLGPPAAVAAPRASARIEYGVGPIVLLLGVLTTAYGAGWLMLLQRSDEVATERMLCRFGVCDTETALRRLRDQTRAAAPDTVPTLAPEVLISYLGRDPAAPYRWDELGDSLVRAGRHEQARTAFMRAVALGPTSASTLLMAAEFQFDAGRSDLGFELTSRA
ncbi:MAG: O-antigen ligase family protein, partial [Vicinamibacterales bacterium]